MNSNDVLALSWSFIPAFSFTCSPDTGRMQPESWPEWHSPPAPREPPFIVFISDSNLDFQTLARMAG